MADTDRLAEQFEEHRARQRAVAYRVLGSLSEADDAVQETWLRLGRADADEIHNLGGRLTTVVARVALNMLRSRGSRREERLPDPAVTLEEALGPEEEALIADEVGLALQVVLDTLPPAERIALVLHDSFAVPFDDIALILGRSVEATRQLASRARRRVQGANALPDADLSSQRRVVDAFFAAARDGDLGALVAVLGPDVVLRPDGGRLVRGAAAVAASAARFADPARRVHPVLVNGAAGVVVTLEGRPVAVMAFLVRRGTIVAIDAITRRERLEALRLGTLDG
jgi:RNA polymerase sigma-70 factor (ECF subfamily)